MSLNLKNMSTETRNQNTMNLDIMSPPGSRHCYEPGRRQSSRSH